MEKWKWIKEFEGVYQISNHGRLKSFKKNPAGRILSSKNKNGQYLSAVLCKKGRKPKSGRIHRFVGMAFIPNPSHKPEINHKDGNKQNNHHSNLEWVTRKENNAHALLNGFANIEGMNRYNKYLRPNPVLQISMDAKVIGKYINCKDAGRKTGVCSRNIHQVASKTEYKPDMTRKQAGGYMWRFDEH